MTETRQLGARFSRETRQQIGAYLDGINSYTPTLGLLYGFGAEEDANGEGSWSLIAYGDENVTELVDLYSNFGMSVCFELDGLNVIVPQIGKLAQLDSGVLEFRDNRLTRRPD